MKLLALYCVVFGLAVFFTPPATGGSTIGHLARRLTLSTLSAKARYTLQVFTSGNLPAFETLTNIARVHKYSSNRGDWSDMDSIERGWRQFAAYKASFGDKDDVNNEYEVINGCYHTGSIDHDQTVFFALPRRKYTDMKKSKEIVMLFSLSFDPILIKQFDFGQYRCSEFEGVTNPRMLCVPYDLLQQVIEVNALVYDNFGY